MYLTANVSPWPRSPLTPVRPTYSAELMMMSFNGGSSLPSTSGGSRGRLNHGSAPDLTSSPVTNIWTNPLNETFSVSGGRTVTGDATVTRRFSPTVSFVLFGRTDQSRLISSNDIWSTRKSEICSSQAYLELVANSSGLDIEVKGLRRL